MWHVGGTGEFIQGFDGGPKERDHVEDKGVEESIILKLICNMCDGEACTRFIWLRIRKWRALENAYIKPRESKNSGDFPH
jgi:hypothetical protein